MRMNIYMYIQFFTLIPRLNFVAALLFMLSPANKYEYDWLSLTFRDQSLLCTSVFLFLSNWKCKFELGELKLKVAVSY